MANEKYKAGVRDAVEGRKPEFPSDKGGYTWENAVLDVFVPGMGFLMQDEPGTASEDREYAEGYKFGIISKK